MKKMLKNPVRSFGMLLVIFILLSAINGWCLSLSGVVLCIDGTPAQGRTMVCSLDPPVDKNPICKSDESGAFCFSNLTAGVYDIQVLPSREELESKNPVYIPQTIELSSLSISDLVLSPIIVSRFDVHGQIRSAITGAPPIEAVIDFTPSSPARTASQILINPNLLDQVEADESGFFFKSNLDAGEYLVTINTPSLQYSPMSVDITITKQGEVTIRDGWLMILTARNIQLILWTTAEQGSD